MTTTTTKTSQSVSISRDNNSTNFEIFGVNCWFSYQTLIAFQLGGNPRIVRENCDGSTTGKHTNAIDGGSKEAIAKRLPKLQFHAAWADMCKRVKIKS